MTLGLDVYIKKLLLASVCLFACSLFSGEIVLAENGQAKAGIVIPAQAKPVVRFAAEQLKEHLDKMTGADFKITEKPNLPVNIYLGAGNGEKMVPDEFVIAAKGNRIDIYGKDSWRRVSLFNLFYDNPDKGTLVGVYHFLDSLGIRWPVPGKNNVFIPKKTRLTVPEQKIDFKPVFTDRRCGSGWDFMKVYPDSRDYVENVDEVYLWGLRNHSSVRLYYSGCHTEHSLRFHENKERLAHPSMLRKGKDGKIDRNYSCWTDPGTTALWIKAADTYFSGKHPHSAGFMVPSYLDSQWPSPFVNPDEFMIDPMDHYTGNDGRCYCSRCEAFRKKYPCADDSEIIWKVICEVANFVKKKYPGKIISTLVYPPKKQFPKYSKIPDNVRVRICIAGSRFTDMPKIGGVELNHLKTWYKGLNGIRSPLWTYQCIIFGRALPGVPDTYPHLHASFLKKIRPYSSGMAVEQHSQTFLFHAVDAYIILRLSWNPSLDVDKELDAYYRMQYGPAAAEAKAFFSRLEENWKRVEKLITVDKESDGSIGLAEEDKQNKQRMVWSQVYTQEELNHLENICRKMAAKCPAGSFYAKRCEMIKKSILDVIRAERGELMEKADRQALLKFPVASDLAKSPVYSLISADRSKKTLAAGGKFRLACNGKYFIIQAEMDEPYLAKSKTNPAHKVGNPDLWQDNCIELFFYSVKTNKYWQVIVNDQGNWTSATKGRVLLKWKQMPGVKVKTEQLAKSWKATVEIPLSELKIDGGELRFNFCRERNITGQLQELSTWSPLAMLGNWNMPENYATVILPESK